VSERPPTIRTAVTSNTSVRRLERITFPLHVFTPIALLPRQLYLFYRGI
jgi:hypothetical protein